MEGVCAKKREKGIGVGGQLNLYLRVSFRCQGGAEEEQR